MIYVVKHHQLQLTCVVKYYCEKKGKTEAKQFAQKVENKTNLQNISVRPVIKFSTKFWKKIWNSTLLKIQTVKMKSSCKF